MPPSSLDREWQRVRTEKGPDLKLFRTRYDYMRNPRNGLVEKMVILESNDSANVVAVQQGHILFVKQYRFGTGTYTLELPGGLVNADESHEVAVRRELQEETGYTSNHWQYLGAIPSNPVFMDSYIHHWFAADVVATHEVSLDDGELVDLVRLPIAEVKQKLYDGYFQHPHAVNALLRYFAFEY